MPAGLFCFSGNGMSRQVAEGLLRVGVGPDDGSSLGFVFPVYGWRPPRILARFVREGLRARLADRPLKYVWAVMTCGFDVGYADAVFDRLLRPVLVLPVLIFDDISLRVDLLLQFVERHGHERGVPKKGIDGG